MPLHHVDHQAKAVSILMYLNEDWPGGEAGGHLLLLKKPPKKGLDALEVRGVSSFPPERPACL